MLGINVLGLFIPHPGSKWAHIDVFRICFLS